MYEGVVELSINCRSTALVISLSEIGLAATRFNELNKNEKIIIETICRACLLKVSFFIINKFIQFDLG
jgi:hypothetical protein